MTIHTGGCQCGAVRFRVDGDLHDSSICHCRMCQKAFGAYYAPLVSTRGANLSWTRGRPKTFRSSVQLVLENKFDFGDRLSPLPGHDTLEDADAAPYLNDVVSYQHPDHDTDVWPPLEKPS